VLLSAPWSQLKNYIFQTSNLRWLIHVYGLLQHINGANMICEVLYCRGNPTIRTTIVSTGYYICAQPRQLLSLIPEQYAQIL
jgi:hypothetical protein